MHSIFIRTSTVVFALFLFAACSTSKPVVDNSPAVGSELKVFTYGDRYQELEKKLRLVHGREFASDLTASNMFSSATYVGDSRDISGNPTTLRITFVYAQQGQTAWPLEVKVHYELKHEEKTLFNKVYEVVASEYSARQICPGCSAEQTALKMLTEKVLPEMQADINKVR